MHFPSEQGYWSEVYLPWKCLRFWAGCENKGYHQPMKRAENELMETREQNKFGSANGNRTRILALKGLRANRCTIAPPGKLQSKIIREMRGFRYAAKQPSRVDSSSQ